MKDQYFGDVNDYRKYGLLRLLFGRSDLHLGVCWMLTQSDGRADGKHLAYLDLPNRYRAHDPVLFDWLKQAVTMERDRRTARIESSSLLGPASFHSEFLVDSAASRKEYFSACGTRFDGCDLVFFDPDNGLETLSTRRGSKDSCKFLYWDELYSVFAAGSSVLVYQHFIREDRAKFLLRMVAMCQERTGATALFSFRTPHVLFLLAAHERHAPSFRSRLEGIRSAWGPTEIIVEEHVAKK